MVRTSWLSSPGWLRWLGPGAVAAIAVVSLLRTGVEPVDMSRFSAYWLIAVLLPGVIVARSLLGVQRTIVEDLPIGAVTGLSLEIGFWVLGTSTGLGSVVRFWWVPVIVVGCAVPAARRAATARMPERVPLLHNAALSAMSLATIVRIDVFGFRNAPLPPQGSALHLDLWWHLSIVHELMRFERPEVPQVAGESLNYHFFSHVHLAMASRLSGVAPEVVLLRLWWMPMVMVSFGLAVVLGRLVTSSLGGGVATAWLAFGVSVSTYLWVDLAVFGANPIVVTSPSQVLANVAIVSAAIGFALFIRNGASPGLLGWLVLVILMSGGTKSTVIPVLIGATVVAAAWAIVTRHRRVRLLIAAAIGLLMVEGAVLLLASGTSGGKIIVLGTVKSLPPYRDLVVGHSRRAVNDGLLLDTITTPRTAALAALTVVIFAGVHATRLIGIAILARREGRANLFNWWLTGAILAGFGATLLVDHVGLSQLYFILSIVPLGAALTMGGIWSASGLSIGERRSFIVRGLAIGTVATLIIDYLARARQRTGGYGALEQVLYPSVLLLVLGVVAMGCWRWWGSSTHVVGGGTALLMAVCVGVVIPAEVELAARSAEQWVQSVDYDVDESAFDFVTTGELTAMKWLRDNSGTADVLVTNVHCRPFEQEGFCDTRGFWVVGMSGRRAVLEAWGYTNEAQAMQGVDGRVWARQPAPFPERAALNDAVFESNDVDAVRALAQEYGADWIVASRRTGSVPVFDSTVAETRFDNGEVVIFEIASTLVSGG